MIGDYLIIYKKKIKNNKKKKKKKKINKNFLSSRLRVGL